ncbi:hypothetical protein AgCh_001235 [Apium graveolens]
MVQQTNLNNSPRPRPKAGFSYNKDGSIQYGGTNEGCTSTEDSSIGRENLCKAFGHSLLKCNDKLDKEQRHTKRHRQQTRARDGGSHVENVNNRTDDELRPLFGCDVILDDEHVLHDAQDANLDNDDLVDFDVEAVTEN